MLSFWFLLSAVLAYFGTELTIGLSRRFRLMDWPNPRSSHTAAIPRLGGVGILCGFYFSLAGAALFAQSGLVLQGFIPRDAFLLVLVGGGMAVTGLYDDLRGLSPAMKFLFELIPAAFVAAEGIRLESVSIPFAPPIYFSLWSIPVTVLWLVAFSNIFNFMDGIDGMAGGTAFVYAGFLFLFAWLEGVPGVGFGALLLAGSSLGFLCHNFPQARTFMGDVGSLFLGMLLAFLVVRLGQQAPQPATLMALLLAFSVYLYDCGYTLLRRLWRRENIFRAHRSHLYQRLVQVGWTHARVTSFYVLMHLVVGSLALLYVRVSNTAQGAIITLTCALLAGVTLTVKQLEKRRFSDRVRRG